MANIELTCDICLSKYFAGRRLAAADGKIRCWTCSLRRQSENRKRNHSKQTTIARNMVNRYGITATDYAKMLVAQQGCCKICGKDTLERLNIDHNHITGKVRGLLCRLCNMGIGHFVDSPALLRKAAEYLESNDG